MDQLPGDKARQCQLAPRQLKLIRAAWPNAGPRTGSRSGSQAALLSESSSL